MSSPPPEPPPEPPRSAFWRTTIFRSSLGYSLIFAVLSAVLLGAIYLQAAQYMTARADAILQAEAQSLEGLPEATAAGRMAAALSLNGGRTSAFGLFAADGRWLAGDLRTPPAGLVPNGAAVEREIAGHPPVRLRLVGRRTAWGGELVIGRNVDPLREVERLVAWALGWAGLFGVCGGLFSGVALSLTAVRRLRRLEGVSRDIAGGDIAARLPVRPGGDELDVLAAAVNVMLEEIERLIAEVKSSADTLAHDLRTPLAHLRARLNRLQDLGGPGAEEVALAIADVEVLMERFRAILRISEIEGSARRAGFGTVDLAALLAELVELYQPLAEDGGAVLTLDTLDEPAVVQADRRLVFEALANLVDNAIKFAGHGARIRLGLKEEAGAVVLVVEDDGPGVPETERAAVLTRFYRGERDRFRPGSGLGLAVVVAIVRLHRWTLTLEDAGPGLRVIIRTAALP